MVKLICVRDQKIVLKAHCVTESLPEPQTGLVHSKKATHLSNLINTSKVCRSRGNILRIENFCSLDELNIENYISFSSGPTRPPGFPPSQPPQHHSTPPSRPPLYSSLPPQHKSHSSSPSPLPAQTQTSPLSPSPNQPNNTPTHY